MSVGCAASSAFSSLAQEGPDALSQFPHSMESHFRSLGLPTLLKVRPGSSPHGFGYIYMSVPPLCLAKHQGSLVELYGLFFSRLGVARDDC